MEGTTALDQAVQASWSLQSGEQPDRLFQALNILGSTAAFAGVTLVSAAIAFMLRLRTQALAIVGTVLVSLLLNSALKRLFERARPIHDGWIEASGFSFPSGNAMIGMALYGILIYVIWSQSRSMVIRVLVLLTGLLLIGIIGYCRLYFGVHYATDIAAGYAAGLACAAIGASVSRISSHRRQRRRRSLHLPLN